MKSIKVAVTGLGVVSPIGIGKDVFWNNLIAAKSGISEITAFDTSNYNRHFGGQVHDFTTSQFIPGKVAKLIGRASQFALVATQLALADAAVAIDSLCDRRVAVIIGATIPEGNVVDQTTLAMFRKEDERFSDRIISSVFAPSIARNIGSVLKINGANMLTPCACAAGNYAIGYGYDLIKNGEVDLAIVGGTEAFSRIAFQGFQRLHAMAENKVMPFDQNRKGMLLGEGAGILILEPFNEAAKRKANIYSEILGYGLSCDASHITIPKKDGIKKAMAKALRNSNVSSDKIDYICAHGTGTPANDKAESIAINEVFSSRRVPVSSIKSMIGHCMGAASSIEAITCCLALQNGVVPPTINFNTSDPECDIDCVPNEARKQNIKIALNNGFAFGGNNCCVSFKRNN
ncbi:MAG: beta-ketoacyl-[acyl-carrier-protein] synthase family protein [Candidatus Omnitrophica bacterium]|nr:beta-ketoacyl-[acyl-carrier-protein] synthase family protein [Candidatus Omnitrophota bacterium]